MSSKKTSEFATKGSFEDNDYLGGYSGSTNYKWPGTQIKSYVLSGASLLSITKQTGKTADTTFAIDANTKLLSIDFKITSGTPTIKAGTSSGGEELIYEETLTANAMREAIHYFEAAGTVYIAISGGTVSINIVTLENYF